MKRRWRKKKELPFDKIKLSISFEVAGNLGKKIIIIIIGFFRIVFNRFWLLNKNWYSRRMYDCTPSCYWNTHKISVTKNFSLLSFFEKFYFSNNLHKIVRSRLIRNSFYANYHFFFFLYISPSASFSLIEHRKRLFVACRLDSVTYWRTKDVKKELIETIVGDKWEENWSEVFITLSDYALHTFCLLKEW